LPAGSPRTRKWDLMGQSLFSQPSLPMRALPGLPTGPALRAGAQTGLGQGRGKWVVGQPRRRVGRLNGQAGRLEPSGRQGSGPRAAVTSRSSRRERLTPTVSLPTELSLAEDSSSPGATLESSTPSHRDPHVREWGILRLHPSGWMDRVYGQRRRRVASWGARSHAVTTLGRNAALRQGEAISLSDRSKGRGEDGPVPISPP
jgi:hypothetical protein